MKKILVMGLPGSGKTTLSGELAKLLDAIQINADEVRSTVTKHLGFLIEDRIEQAKVMKKLSDEALESGRYVVVDFVCPTRETRKAFDDSSAFVVWVDRINKSRYEDTNEIFQPPKVNQYDVRVYDEGSAQKWAEHVKHLLDFPLDFS